VAGAVQRTMEEYDTPRSAALGNGSAWLGVDNFIQPFDALSKFFRTRLSQALANPLLGMGGRCVVACRLRCSSPGGVGIRGGNLIPEHRLLASWSAYACTSRCPAFRPLCLLWHVETAPSSPRTLAVSVPVTNEDQIC